MNRKNKPMKEVAQKILMIDRVPNYTRADFETFIAHPDHRHRYFEFIDGEIIEKPMPTEEHGVIVGRIVTELGIYLKQNPLGRVAVEVLQHPADDANNIRQPDISLFFGDERPILKKGIVPTLAPMIIEVKSPNDTYAELRAKAAYYLDHGAMVVWLVYPEKRFLEVYRPTADIEIYLDDEVLHDTTVLPNFTLAISEIFA